MKIKLKNCFFLNKHGKSTIYKINKINGKSNDLLKKGKNTDIGVCAGSSAAKTHSENFLYMQLLKCTPAFVVNQRKMLVSARFCQQQNVFIKFENKTPWNVQFELQCEILIDYKSFCLRDVIILKKLQFGKKY